MGWKKILTEESEFKALDVLSIGWHTIAINGEGIATARFLLSDNRSTQQSSVITFYASHVEGEGNQITLLSSTNFSSTNITQTALRIKESGIGMGAVLQVFISSETNKPIVQLLGDNYKNSTPGGANINNGWKLTNFIPDGLESPDITLISNNEWDSFTQATRLNLNVDNLGLATTGNISGEASSIGTLTTLELNDGSIIDNSEFITITAENAITNFNNSNVNLIFNDIVGTNTDGSFPSLFSIANSGEEGNINVDYNIFGKLGYSPIITQMKLYAGFGNFESDLYKIKIFGSNTPFTGGNLGTLLYEDLDYVNGVGVDYPYIVNFQNETPFKYYRTQYISNSNNNSTFLISIYEIYYSEGVETTIKDSTVTTNNIVLSMNTAGTTSDDIVVRDSSGNLKTVSIDTISNLVDADSDNLPTSAPSAGTLVSEFSHLSTNTLHVDVHENANNTPYPIVFSNLTDGFSTILLDSNVTINPHTDTIKSTNFEGNLIGTLDSYNSEAFINETHTKQQAPNDLAPGWYTVAIVPVGRATGRFALRDQQGSARHQSTTFYASHIYGDDKGTQLTVLNNNSYSNIVYTHIRIKEGHIYDGAALQVYVRDTDTLNSDNLEETNHSTRLSVFLLGDNYLEESSNSHKWRLVNWIPDTDNPGVSISTSSTTTWANFTSKAEVNLEDFWAGMAVTPGPISGSFIGNGSGLENVCGKRVYLSTTTNGADYPIPFQFGTTTAAGCMDLAKDSANDFTYNPSLNILKVPKITVDTINTKVLRYQEFSADWHTATTKKYLPLSNAYFNETTSAGIYYSRYIFTDDVAVSDVKIEMRMERSMNFKLEVRHHPLGGILSSGFNQFNSNGFVYNNDTVFEHVLDNGPANGFNKGDFLYIAIDPIGSGESNSPGEVNGHLIICYDNKQTLTSGVNTAPTIPTIIS